MNEIQQLQRQVKEFCPQAYTHLDEPLRIDGHWFLDVSHDDTSIAIEWRPRQGYGLALKTGGRYDGYGEGPDEILPDLPAITQRLKELLKV